MQCEEKIKTERKNNESIHSHVCLLFSLQGVNPVLQRIFPERFPDGNTSAPAFPAFIYYVFICFPLRSSFYPISQSGRGCVDFQFIVAHSSLAQAVRICSSLGCSVWYLFEVQTSERIPKSVRAGTVWISKAK